MHNLNLIILSIVISFNRHSRKCLVYFIILCSELFTKML